MSSSAHIVVGKRGEKRKFWRTNPLFNLLKIRFEENKIRI